MGPTDGSHSANGADPEANGTDPDPNGLNGTRGSQEPGMTIFS